jgi:hypothetical protein
MKCRSLTLLCVICLTTYLCQCQRSSVSTNNQGTLDNLYEVLSTSSSGEKTALVLAYPGIPILMGANDSEQTRLLSLTLDRVPSSTAKYSVASNATLQQLYSHVLSLQKESPRPDAATKAEVTAAHSLLFEDGANSRAYQEYLQYKSAYDNAVSSVNNKSAPTFSERQKMETARQDWIELGRKDEVEAALRLINEQQLPGRPEAHIGEQFHKYEIQSSDGSYEVLNTFPNASSWSTDKLWSRIKLSLPKASKARTRPNNPATLPNTLWTVKATPNSEMRGVAASTSTTTISFELLRVAIDRPWFSPELIQSTHSAESTNGLIVCTDLLLARNVQLQGFNKKDSEWIQASLKQKQKLGWGPFVVAGNAFDSSMLPYIRGHFENNTLNIPFLQIIGWYCNQY